MFNLDSIIGSLPNGINATFVFAGVAIAAFGAYFYMQANQKLKADYTAYLRREAKEKNLPIIEVVDLSGYSQEYLGVIDDETDVKFDGSPIGLQIRPSILEGQTPIVKDGVREYSYFGNMYYPNNRRNMFVLSTYVEKFREVYPKCNFIDNDLEIVCFLLGSDGEALRYNCEKIIQEYDQNDYLEDENGDKIPLTEIKTIELLDEEGEVVVDEDGEVMYEEVEEIVYDEDGNMMFVENDEKINNDELYKIIKEAKIRIGAMNVRGGFINYQKAMQLIPVSLDGLQLQRIMKIVQMKTELLSTKEDPWIKWGSIAVAGVFIGLGAIAVTKQVLGA